MPEGRLSRARRMWSVLEVVHAPVYFAPEPVLAYEALGLHGYWRSYYAGRVSPWARSVLTRSSRSSTASRRAAPRRAASRPPCLPGHLGSYDTSRRSGGSALGGVRRSRAGVARPRELVSVTAGALREAVDGANLEGCPLGSVGRTVRVTTTRASRRDRPRPAGGPAAQCERPTALHPDAPDRPPPPAGTPTSGRSRSRLR